MKSLECELELMKETIEENNAELQVQRCYNNGMRDKHFVSGACINTMPITVREL